MYPERRSMITEIFDKGTEHSRKSDQTCQVTLTKNVGEDTKFIKKLEKVLNVRTRKSRSTTVARKKHTAPSWVTYLSRPSERQLLSTLFFFRERLPERNLRCIDKLLKATEKVHYKKIVQRKREKTPKKKPRFETVNESILTEVSLSPEDIQEASGTYSLYRSLFRRVDKGIQTPSEDATNVRIFL